uniref:Uncharacterized protein n=1 Tax=Arundo donax TaxID=35708 RepID=A0A0A9FFY7_ARUDO
MRKHLLRAYDETRGNMHPHTTTSTTIICNFVRFIQTVVGPNFSFIMLLDRKNHCAPRSGVGVSRWPHYWPPVYTQEP